jgi:hypothetical protein
METVAPVRHAMQTVLTTLAAEADMELHSTKRPDVATFTASTLVQTLVFGWLAHPDATVEQLAQMAATVGVDVTPQALGRCDPTPAVGQTPAHGRPRGPRPRVSRSGGMRSSRANRRPHHLRRGRY